MGNFMSLTVWKKGKDLAVFVYKVTRQGSIAKDFALRDQMCRAAVSIPSNIAEGDQLDSNQQSIRHLYIARGSAAELHTLAIIARETGLLQEKEFEHIARECNEISGMLCRLIGARANNPKPTNPKAHSPGPHSPAPTPRTSHPAPRTSHPAPDPQ